MNRKKAIIILFLIGVILFALMFLFSSWRYPSTTIDLKAKFGLKGTIGCYELDNERKNLYIVESTPKAKNYFHVTFHKINLENFSIKSSKVFELDSHVNFCTLLITAEDTHYLSRNGSYSYKFSSNLESIVEIPIISEEEFIELADTKKIAKTYPIKYFSPSDNLYLSYEDSYAKLERENLNRKWILFELDDQSVVQVYYTDVLRYGVMKHVVVEPFIVELGDDTPGRYVTLEKDFPAIFEKYKLYTMGYDYNEKLDRKWIEFNDSNNSFFYMEMCKLGSVDHNSMGSPCLIRSKIFLINNVKTFYGPSESLDFTGSRRIMTYDKRLVFKSANINSELFEKGTVYITRSPVVF